MKKVSQTVAPKKTPFNAKDYERNGICIDEVLEIK
jgi:hypothetical protein